MYASNYSCGHSTDLKRNLTSRVVKPPGGRLLKTDLSRRRADRCGDTSPRWRCGGYRASITLAPKFTPSRRWRGGKNYKTTPIRTPRDKAPRAPAPTDAPRRPGRFDLRTPTLGRPPEKVNRHRSRPRATPTRRRRRRRGATLTPSARRRFDCFSVAAL